MRLQREFIWRDGERTIIFRADALDRAGATLADYGWEGWELLTTPRALAGAPLDFASGASAVHEVQPGRVDELFAGLVTVSAGAPDAPDEHSRKRRKRRFFSRSSS